MPVGALECPLSHTREAFETLPEKAVKLGYAMKRLHCA